MATVLRFDVDEIKALVRHAKAGPTWDMGFDDGDVDEFPGLLLAKDHGVYLRSNAKVGQPVLAYAKGHNPRVDEGWCGRARQVPGNEGFAELIPLFVFEDALKVGLLGRLFPKNKEVWLVVSEHGYGVALRSSETN